MPEQAPTVARLDEFSEMPNRGGRVVAVPGLVDAWALIHRLASRPLAALLSPAIDLAENGFPISWRLASAITAYSRTLNDDPGCREVFVKNGVQPAGTILRQADLGRTLQAIIRGTPLQKQIACCRVAPSVRGGFREAAEWRTISLRLE
jgi:gamma-glutamyltranspeptidase